MESNWRANIPRVGWAMEDWVLAARLLYPGTSRFYLVQRWQTPGTWWVYSITPEWVVNVDTTPASGSFPGLFKDVVERDSGYSVLNREMAEDW